MDVLKTIKKRRSIRKFKKDKISKYTLNLILEAGRWAPSGLNNQPWRFKIAEGQLKGSLAQYTEYSHIINSADKLILVFLDNKNSYNREKDLMAIGACLQNMLLYIHSKKLGACWLGEILNKKKEIHKQLKISGNLELMAVIALGIPVIIPKPTNRKQIKKLMV
jgi:nitroreductase